MKKNNWDNDAIQFPRLIEEAQAAGAFTPQVIADMADSMDLGVDNVYILCYTTPDGKERSCYEQYEESLGI